MPAWNKILEPHIRSGKLVVLGIAQEQHAARTRLFLQWHGIDWTVVHDPINLMQVRGVPIEVAVDEYGIVRATRLKKESLEKDFLNLNFPLPKDKTLHEAVPTRSPDVDALRRQALKNPSAETWRDLGDALALWEEPSKLQDAIDAYSQAISIEPKDGDAFFRLGVCLLRRSETEAAQPSDFQAAVDRWTQARVINPNQYIWRRRIEQYGPRLEKPYPFYDWVERASRDIKDRGESPVQLEVLPTGSEMARPDPKKSIALGELKAPDPLGRIFRDKHRMVQIETAVVPSRVKAGDRVRVYVTLWPNRKKKAHWNNEAEPLTLWIDPPQGFKASPQLLTAPQGSEPATSETRRLEFDVLTPSSADGSYTLEAYALYYVCEDIDGVCMFLRQDISIPVTVNKKR